MPRKQQHLIPERERCPIFVSVSETEITCRSCVNGSRCSVIRFDDRIQREQQTEIFCKQNYKRCEQFLSWKHFSWQDCD